MTLLRGEEDGVSPVIGVVLMVAITVALAAVVAIVVTSSGEDLNEGSANAKVEFQSTTTGLVLKIEQISTDAEVQVNGETIKTISKDAAGQTISLPSAPGDKITIVSGNRQSSVLVSKTVDESESPDFIVFYRMDESKDSTTVTDESGNGNTGTVGGTSAVDFIDGFARFNDGSGDANMIEADSLDTEGTVDEMTVAMRYNVKSWDSSGDALSLLEYNVPSGGGTFNLALRDGYNSPNHRVKASYPDGSGGSISVNEYGISSDETHNVIATHDDDGFKVYIDGERVASKGSGADFTLGTLKIGRDGCCERRNYEGKIYEFRLYYEAFDEGEVDTLFTSMKS